MTFHLHIKGRVQGVGFRPRIFKIAVEKKISGYTTNVADGVHVFFNVVSTHQANDFVQSIIQQAPHKAVILNWSLTETPSQPFADFSIRVEENNAAPDLLISPDFAMCEQCKQEFADPVNRRFHYPFITCTLCGPRYSIMKQLPYERHLTTMQNFNQCPECRREYENVNDRRYFSQTNACATCGVQLSWSSKNDEGVLNSPAEILSALLKAITDGKIIAVKGIGGFLLMCDASNSAAIQKLRERKHRPVKPFAVLFPTVEMVKQYTEANDAAIDVLTGEASPIVILPATELSFQQLDMRGIAPGLTSIGVMIPYAPLLEWISSAQQKPLIATSGNLSGSCIVFQSENKETLFEFADFILDHNRDIVVPQDDSVVKFSEKNAQPIFLRRARGIAPATIPGTEPNKAETIFAAGAMLKSTFAIQHNHQVYLSQFLGNLESYDAQQNYRHTLLHFQKLLKTQPEIILADLHPDYASTQIATEISANLKVPLKKIQHHEAHFAAILGEHNLFKEDEKILGVIWDGTGLGSDGNIWGGEFFVYTKGRMERIHYLEPFVNLAGEKLALEPRLAAFAVANQFTEVTDLLQKKFTEQEWSYYRKAVAQPVLKNTSAGRYFDAVASLLDLVNKNTYEGEASLMLEQAAADFLKKNNFNTDANYFEEEIGVPSISMRGVLSKIIADIGRGKETAEIAAYFHRAMVTIIKQVAVKERVKKIAFSGGVFQNSVLMDLVHLQVGKDFETFFHRQMPPNDECIAFGQLMHYQNTNQ